jgi:ribosomal protein L24E
MKLPRFSCLTAFLGLLLIGLGALRADDTPADTKDEKQVVNFCIVSGEHLQPGEIVTYVYKEEGKPDRTLRFCCRKCLVRFKANPAFYLKKLDQLESARKESVKAGVEQ